MEILDQPTSTELKIASDGNRIIAYLIDAVLIGMVSIIPFGFILGVAYFITKDALPFLDGQSIGKR
ncbi:MAG: hypothetical protein R2792_11555 [Saprospiraceae bacterium]